MWLVCSSLEKTFGYTWLLQHLTIYADDFLLQWVFHTHQDYLRARREILVVIDTLTKHGMQVNTTKSALLMKVAGKQAHLVQKHIQKTSLGPMYTIHDKHASFTIPLKAKHEYLGAIISYGAFEKYTFLKRQTQAITIFDQLKPILRDHRHHHIQQRLKLYDMSVLVSLQYGLNVCGLTKATEQQYHALIIKHYRYIAKSPLHIAHESNEVLLARLQRKPPLNQFDKLHSKWQMSQEQLLHTLAPQDILHTHPTIPPLRPAPPQEPEPAAAAAAEPTPPSYICESCQ